MTALKTIWIAHRGLKVKHTENSLEAFSAARAAGFPCLETDLRVTADQVLVHSHDDSLLRTAGLAAKISQTTWPELAAIRLKGGEQLARFEAFADEFQNCHWILDIKPEHGVSTVTALHRWASQRTSRLEFLIKNCRFLLWRRAQEAVVKSLFPGAVCLPREAACYRAGLTHKLFWGLGSGIRSGATYALMARFAGMSFFEPAIVKRYHRKEAKVLAFLPATAEDHAAAIRAGFDEILTDGPILA